MDKITLLEQIKTYFSEVEQKRMFQRVQNDLKYAIEHFDVELIVELLQNGASIQELEKEKSSLVLAIGAYQDQCHDLMEQYRKKNRYKYSGYYENYMQLESGEVPLELRNQMDVIMAKVLPTLETLYQYGADINHHTYLGYQEGFLQDGRELKERPNVLETACYSLGFYNRNTSIIKWVLSKPNLDIQKSSDTRIISNFLALEFHESIEALQLVLERGLPIREESRLSIRFLGTPYTSLIDCLVHQDAKYRQEKFNLLWKYATESQKNNLINHFDVSSIEIPQSEKSI